MFANVIMLPKITFFFPVGEKSNIWNIKVFLANEMAWIQPV